MIDFIRKFMRHITTESDGTSFDVARVVFILGGLTYVGLAIAHYVAMHVFDPVSFGSGFGALMGGGAAGIGARGRLEGPSKPDAFHAPSDMMPGAHGVQADSPDGPTEG